MWYNFNINRYVSNYVFKTLRGSASLLDYCQSLLEPIETAQSDIFNDFYTDTIDRAKWNGQVLVLEQILNQEYGLDFDPDPSVNSDIYISNTITEDANIFMYNESEFSGNRPIYIANEPNDPFIYLYNSVQILKEFDFQIFYPLADITNTTRIKTITNQLKISGPSYRVVGY